MTADEFEARQTYYREAYRYLVLLRMEGWVFLSSGDGRYCYFVKGDEYYQHVPLGACLYAAEMLQDRLFWRRLCADAEAERLMIEYYI